MKDICQQWADPYATSSDTQYNLNISFSDNKYIVIATFADTNYSPVAKNNVINNNIRTTTYFGVWFGNNVTWGSAGIVWIAVGK